MAISYKHISSERLRFNYINFKKMVKGMITSTSDRPSFLILASKLRAGCTQEFNIEDERQDLLGNKNTIFLLCPVVVQTEVSD